MVVTRGKKHMYLGMDFDYTTKGVVKVSMDGYIEEMLEEFPKHVVKPAKMCAANHLLTDVSERQET